MFTTTYLRYSIAIPLKRLLNTVPSLLVKPPSFVSVRRFSSKTKCWNCNVTHALELLCPSCQSIQCTNCTSTQLNYFQIFKLTESFDIDLMNLKPLYIKLQAVLHPDKFATASQLEKEYSNTQSALVNEAFKTLVEPLKRGLYMLKLHGFELDSETVDASSDNETLLNEIFMLNFQVDDSESSDELTELSLQITGDINTDLKCIDKAFRQCDFDSAKSALIRVRYRNNLKNKIENKLLELSL